jgi:hypothetical protein
MSDTSKADYTPGLPRRGLKRRRDEGLQLKVPIHVEGVGRTGEKFGEDTRTTVIYRQGARILLKHPIAAGAMLAVSSKIGNRNAKFRVVGPTQPNTAEGWEWAIECLGDNRALWRVGFPPAQKEKEFSSVLIECRRCQTAKPHDLSMVELEVLETSGLLVKECDQCGRLTPWSHSRPALDNPGGELGRSFPDTETPEVSAPGIQRRIHNRAALQMPLRVRSYYSSEEFNRSENVSRGGVCFITDRTYEVGEVLLVTCPYEKGGHNFEVRGQVVRRREMMGTGSTIYGVAYER